MIAALAAAAVGYVTIDLPNDPRLGFAVDKDGNVLLGMPLENKAVKIGLYKRVGAELTLEKTFDQEYKGSVEILPLNDGFGVVDFEGSQVSKVSYEGKVIWKTHARYPIAARLDFEGNIWCIFNSGIVAVKTDDSSDVEPILKTSGEEVAIHGGADIAPTVGMRCWIADVGGGLEMYDGKCGLKSVAVLDAAQRMVAMKNGSALVYDGKAFLTITPDGKRGTSYPVPQEFIRGLSYIGRTYDGRLLLAITQGKKGRAAIMDVRLGAP